MPWWQSAGSGAATGASAGSVVPGIGTGVGGAVGAIVGGLGRLGKRCDRSSCETGHEKLVGQANNSSAAWNRVDDMAAVLGLIPSGNFGDFGNPSGYGSGAARQKVLDVTGTTIEDWLRIHLDVFVPMCQAAGDPLTCDAERGEEAVAHRIVVRKRFRDQLASGRVAGVSRVVRGSTGGDPDFSPYVGQGAGPATPSAAGFGSVGIIAIAALALFALKS